VLARCFSETAGPDPGIRRRWWQDGRPLREQTCSHRSIPCSLGAECNGAVWQEKIPASLPRRRFHRLPRIMGPYAVSASWLQRGLSDARGDRASGRCEIFADGFAGAVKSTAQAEHRPTGLALGPDGSFYVFDDVRGRIYRIDYRGGAYFNAASVTPCPSAAAPAGNSVEEAAQPPECTHPDAGAAANSNLPVPEGATREMVLLGERVDRGQVAWASHGDFDSVTANRLCDRKSWRAPRLTSLLIANESFDCHPLAMLD